MRRTSEDVRLALSDFRDENGEPAASFTFNDGFVGFDGHFPKNKVLPGVCQIQCVKAVLERWKASKVKVDEIVTAKYASPVGPGDRIECRVSGVTPTGGGYSLRARLMKGDVKVSDFKLKVSFNGDAVVRPDLDRG